MANPWFRLYSEFANDPKVQMLSEQDQRRYIMLLCMRCSNGDVTLHETEIAFQLRISNEEWCSTKAVLVGKNLIGEDNKPTAWEKRQYASDSSAARVSKHRKNKKQQCNVTVTPPDTDTDTDTDTEKPFVLPADAEAKPKTKRATLFPDDFVPNETCLKLAAELGIDPSAELPKFGDHHRMKGTLGKDWQAGFRTWLNNAVKFGHGGNVENRPTANGLPIRDPMIYGFDVANGDPLPDGWRLPPTGETRYMPGIGWVLSPSKPPAEKPAKPREVSLC